MGNQVRIERCEDYEAERIANALEPFDSLFAENIHPGQTILLKPNWIAPHHKYDPEEWQSVITHPNFITEIAKRALRYLKGSGRLVIADSPQNDCIFAKLVERLAIPEWKQLGAAHGLEVEIVDLRDHENVVEDGVVLKRRDLPGDPQGSVEFNLRDHSEFVEHVPSERGYYGADYDVAETTRAHANGDHRYRISRSAILADVFINLPKMKTHKKAGITASLKNLVGINTYKNYLPHHTEGTPSMGGDQFPDNRFKNSMEAAVRKRFADLLLRHERYSRLMLPVKKAGALLFGSTRERIRNGNWYGNDTVWRMILDLNKLLLYGNPDGSMRESDVAQRKPYLTFIDGITAGEGDGPEAPNPVEAGLIIGGSSPVSVDCAAAKLMGFDYCKIPSLAGAFRVASFPLADFEYEEIAICSRSIESYNGRLVELSAESCFHFEPHFGWKEHIELDASAVA